VIRYTQGNLLEAPTEALVNTVNTVGVMGKGIALQFKEAYPENFRLYAQACTRGEVRVGQMFITENPALTGARWIINFPTKEHWRAPSRLEWIESGLAALSSEITTRSIKSIAIPPLGSGNGGLNWSDVHARIARWLGHLEDVEVFVFEPTAQYQSVAKRAGVSRLTPARALIAELVRRYSLAGIPCTLLESQKLAWFLEREIEASGLANPLELQFVAHRYGPYADRLRHLLDSLDGSYLHCDKRIADAGPVDEIYFDSTKRDRLELFLRTEGKDFLEALERTAARIEGFESPLGMELLATVDWLLHREGIAPDLASIKKGLENWPGGNGAGERKLRIFEDRMISLALGRLAT
jgi:O-acetyl-ADP-ribose deacetylase (regulator of RNase III)